MHQVATSGTHLDALGSKLEALRPNLDSLSSHLDALRPNLGSLCSHLDAGESGYVTADLFEHLAHSLRRILSEVLVDQAVLFVERVQAALDNFRHDFLWFAVTQRNLREGFPLVLHHVGGYRVLRNVVG